MFQLFLRSRGQNLLPRVAGQSPHENGFKARNIRRDADTDRARIAAVLAAIEQALSEAEDEHAGLSKRVDDALARAAVTFGNGTDEYLEREPLDNHHQDLFAADISNGQRRLDELSAAISHFKFIRAATLTRFPDSKPQQLSS